MQRGQGINACGVVRVLAGGVLCGTCKGLQDRPCVDGHTRYRRHRAIAGKHRYRLADARVLMAALDPDLACYSES